MADIVDQAQDQNPDALATSQRRPAGPPFTGQCHYCEADVPHPRRFCDEDCRDGWQAEQDAAQRNRRGGDE